MMTILKERNAIIIIGEQDFISPGRNYDIYFYPYNITQYELEQEISDLSLFYNDVVLGGLIPPHIRQ